MRQGKPELKALRRLLFATCIFLGLTFAVVCYAEMLGVVSSIRAENCKALAMRIAADFDPLYDPGPLADF